MSNTEIKTRIVENVKKVIDAPSCCPELRAVAEEWLQAQGTEAERELNAKLIAELEEDVCTLDDVLLFFESEAGVRAEGAKAKADEAKQAKANGEIYCLCPACQAGSAVLADKEELL